MEQYALGIDIGTTAVKVLLIDSSGHLVRSVSREHTLYSARSGWAEEDAEVWWDNVQSALQEIASSCARELQSLRAVGVSGMVPALVFLDEQGQVLRRTIQQNDSRCGQEIDELLAKLDQEEVFRRTGSMTNQQHLLPRLLWVKRNEPDLFARVRHVIGSYDYIVYRLTGVLQVEQNWAAESGAYDIYKRCWIPEWFEVCGIDSSIIPAVHGSLDMVGTVTAGHTIPAGVPVISGSADHVASALAAGMVDPENLLIKFGGAGDILYCTGEPVALRELYFDYHVVPGRCLINGCTATSGSLLKWIVRTVYQDEAADAFLRLDAEADKIPAGSHGLVLLPYFLGEKTPLFDLEASGVFCGLRLSHGRADMYRAVLEAVVYSFRHHVEILEKAGYRARQVIATDGGAKSRVWCQIAADVLGVPVRSYPSHPGSALGVAYAAGMAAHMFDDWHDITMFLTEHADYVPDPANTAVYDKGYAIYRDLYTVLKEHRIFTRLSDLSQIPNSI